MMTSALTPIPTTLKLGLNQKLKGENKKRVQLTKAPKNPEVSYRKKLLLLTKSLKSDVDRLLIPALEALEKDYVSDSYASELAEVFKSLRVLYAGVGVQAEAISNSFVQGTNEVNKQRFYSAMNSAIGIDLKSVLQNEGLEGTLQATTSSNVSLIKSIPEEFFKKIESIVYTETTQGTSAKSMIQQIRKVGKVTEKRAKLIARDQTAKLNSALNQKRAQNIGSEEYTWRTAGDERVRESHATKNGKVFRWDTPPKDTGHPGKDIQCRCIAQPIIKI